MARPLYAQINLTAMRENLARVREKAPGTQVLAVVKANAYGHGLTRVLPALEDADGLALVELDAAIGLREKRYMRRILLLEGFFAESELDEVAHRRLAIVVHDIEQVKMLEAAVLARPLEVFVKVNTGMNRLGFRPAAVAGICERLARAPAVAALRLMTHIARAEEEDGSGRAARAVRDRMPRPALSALCSQFGRDHPLFRNRAAISSGLESCSTARRRCPTTRRTCWDCAR